MDELSRKKVIFVPSTVDGRPDTLPSYYSRCKVIAPLINADIYDIQDISQYDVVIFQKAYLKEKAQGLLKKARIKIFDICGAEWLDDRKDKFWQMVKDCDICICSSEKLAEEVKKRNKNTFYIPDRIDLRHNWQKKVHKNIENPLLVWHGISLNFERVTKTLLPYIIKKKYPLKVIGDKIEIKPQRYNDFKGITKRVEWSFDTVNEELIEGDIGINPTLDEGMHHYATYNKTYKMWALGLPVAHTIAELERFMDVKERIKESQKCLQEVREKWDVRISGKEWKTILNSI